MLSLGHEFEAEMGYSPNTELDWRNQATAHSDCLLKYKEAAKFVIVSDIDDVLFPRIGDTYIEEFMKLSRDYPHAAGFMYDRYNTEVTTHLNPNKFSLSSLIDSSEIRDEWEDGKSVYNPERVFTAWIHWPGLTHQPGYKMQLVSSEQNIMVHMRKWKMVSHINVISMRGSRSDFIANGLPLTHFQGPPDAQSSTKKKLKSKARKALTALDGTFIAAPLGF
ncbi:hypothetical protein L596_004407 [Steinernema carpocapsae]|uniref:Glycosyltransferase family 92 protein n=1 Tax=Steinernema carpocapsae TaxID=34508 RepID=A0A4U8UX81_STECR|nr:hypothetical protein L596_004407 [Steinernema carpocapsae]